MVRLASRGYLNMLDVDLGIERMGFLSAILPSLALTD